MKKLHTLLVILFVSASVFAQRPDKEKIKALKVAHITEQLDLSKQEAQQFWPVYNANEEAENKLRAKTNERRKRKKADELSENEAKALLMDLISLEREEVELESKYLNDLLTVLPAKKIVALLQAERSFKRKMFEEYKSRHSRNRRN
ncbi:hypothetical protein [Winogradskyella ursingii]|uniref:hypothetical protein n=1 Tax=Winogradskyella ursingii TaxID=2686079 RepID=UPI0015CD5384|nr:hypothetical protein [Winogradskyella ursingii]